MVTPELIFLKMLTFKIKFLGNKLIIVMFVVLLLTSNYNNFLTLKTIVLGYVNRFQLKMGKTSLKTIVFKVKNLPWLFSDST